MLEKDETALQELIVQYGDELQRTAYLIVKDEQAAEEAVMDTFVQAYNKIGQLKQPAKLRSWLLRIVINQCRMRVRTWSWRNMLPFAYMDPVIEETEPGPEDYFFAKWRNTQLSTAIHGLDYKYREVITLYYYNGLSITEIADQLGSKENTIKARLARGRIQLRKRLEGDGDEARAGVY
ncbi:RNA polymerase sigma factor [Cohnella sp. WQ 127256]|uniref:RNA polymerase sigma factor n=1 Tax=Cohnella sp. WQ 127256 TaxID=2938790 RepID=UPI0021183C8B|nr:sigma-70 family RNA polymerase sigma factor [Cohnella sp. WQ 127256]